jgi:hypothetical protein
MYPLFPNCATIMHIKIKPQLYVARGAKASAAIMERR